MAFFGVNFIFQKFCKCKKMTNMRYVSLIVLITDRLLPLIFEQHFLNGAILWNDNEIRYEQICIDLPYSSATLSNCCFLRHVELNENDNYWYIRNVYTSIKQWREKNEKWKQTEKIEKPIPSEWPLVSSTNEWVLIF